MKTRHLTVACSLSCAALGLALLVWGAHQDVSRAWYAYLAAWTYGASLCIGALLWLMVSHISKAGWVVVTRRLTEAIVSTLPLYLLLFLPLCCAFRVGGPWAETGRPAAERFATAFFVLRGVGYFAVFGVVGALLRRWSRQTDARPDAALARRMRALSGGALPVVAMALTAASFDWTMSLEPEWHSTIFGLYWFAGAFVAALAALAALLPALGRRGGTFSPEHGHALGRVLFAMIAFWAYMAFSQLLIIWIADLPEEVGYYQLRSTGSWRLTTYVLAGGHFVLPFLMLLSRRAKRHLPYLSVIGGWMLLMHFVDVYWMVLPVHDRTGMRLHLLDLAALLLLGGASIAWIARAYTRAPPLPHNAPELADGLAYEAAT